MQMKLTLLFEVVVRKMMNLRMQTSNTLKIYIDICYWVDEDLSFQLELTL